MGANQIGGHAAISILETYGVDTVFGIPGVHTLDLYRGIADRKMRHIGVRHEQGAGFMADGYARVSGKPGFVYGQRGPGVANVASALPDALWACSPVISLTSSINMAHRDRYEYQELDGIPMNAAVTKWNKPISHASRAAAMLRAAIRVATGPAPGPVHLEIPADMFRADAGKDPVYREESLGVVNARRIPPEPGVMRRVVERLLKAERPLLIAGKLRHRLADARELLGRRQPVRAARGDALAHLALDAGDAHHEEFIEVVGGDGEEAHPLENRMALIGGLFKHPAIEVQPGQFAVDEAFRARPQTLFGRGIGGRCGLGATVAHWNDFLNRRNGLSVVRHEKLASRLKLLAA